MEAYLISSAPPFALSERFLRCFFHIANRARVILCKVSRFRAVFVPFALSCLVAGYSQVPNACFPPTNGSVLFPPDGMRREAGSTHTAFARKSVRQWIFLPSWSQIPLPSDSLPTSPCQRQAPCRHRHGSPCLNPAVSKARSFGMHMPWDGRPDSVLNAIPQTALVRFKFYDKVTAFPPDLPAYSLRF